ncbi:MAG: hypothetical protein ABEJ88_05825 [Halobacterium sp.]
MNWKALARAAGALLALAGVAAAGFLALVTVLVRVGVPQWTASPAAAAAVVAAVLPAADVYTPLGNTRRTERLRAKAADALAVDFALAAAVGFVAGYAGATILLSGQTAGLARTAVVAVGVALGYGTFVARNVDVYRPSGRPQGEYSGR